MPPDLTSSGSVRSAAQLNEDIRRLARRSFGRRMTDAERAEYEVLIVAWVEAKRVPVVEVA